MRRYWLSDLLRFLGVGGVVMDRSTDQPFFNLDDIAFAVISKSSAQAVMHCVRPLSVRLILRFEFLACSLGVAHRQLSLKYPCDPSILSIVSPSGRSPMSA